MLEGVELSFISIYLTGLESHHNHCGFALRSPRSLVSPAESESSSTPFTPPESVRKFVLLEAWRRIFIPAVMPLARKRPWLSVLTSSPIWDAHQVTGRKNVGS